MQEKLYSILTENTICLKKKKISWHHIISLYDIIYKYTNLPEKVAGIKNFKTKNFQEKDKKWKKLCVKKKSKICDFMNLQIYKKETLKFQL